jgi:hypothetical protein
MAMRIFIAWCCLIFLLGANLFCKDEDQQTPPQKLPGKQKESVQLDCIPRDTVLSDGVFVRYVQSDSVFLIAYGKGEFTKTLNYRFNCNTPQAIIPVYIWDNDLYVCLVRSCGSFCKKYLLFPLVASLQNRQFENLITWDQKKDWVAYLKPEIDSTVLLFENLRSEKKKEIFLRKNPCGSLGDCVDIKMINHKAVITWRDDNNTPKKLVTEL